MAKKHSLDLFQNAIDSLNEGLEIYEKALENESKYKFSIVIISNFMELLLKCMVEKYSPLLIYVEPYSSKISKAKTITWEQALQILTNSKVVIEKKLIEDIKRLTELRNNIIHYKFEYDVYEIDAIILSVVDGLRKLYKTIFGKDLIDIVNKNTKLLLEKIAGDYLSQLHQAQFNAKEEREENGCEIVDCPFCGESNTAIENPDGEKSCFFCEEIDFEVNCSRCTHPYMVSEMEYAGESECGDSLYFCDYCIDLMCKDD